VKMTKKDLVKRIHEQTGLPATRISDIVETLLETVKESLEQGDAVKISRFGQFVVKKKRERPGRNPQTGESMVIPARSVLTFKPSNMLRDRVNRRS